MKTGGGNRFNLPNLIALTWTFVQAGNTTATGKTGKNREKQGKKHRDEKKTCKTC